MHDDLDLLRLEHETYVNALTASEMVTRSLAFFGMLLAMYTLSGFYIYYRAPSIYASMWRFSSMLGMFVAAVTLAAMTKDDAWRAESVPIMLFGMTVALVYNQELSLLLTAALVLVVAVVVLDEDLSCYITLMSAAVSSILLLGRIRSRSKLIYVGHCCRRHCHVYRNRRQHFGRPAAEANLDWSTCRRSAGGRLRPDF